ncbi:MAG: dihydrofolate reductase family protein, partial [Nitrososphaerales archaeon]
ESYWPKVEEDPVTSPDNREIARLMNNTEKFVFSRTLDKLSETKNWKNVKLIRELNLAEIRHLKEQPGREIGVGGPNLALSLIKDGLIDELRIMLVPVAIGSGSTLFQGLEGKLNLELAKTRRFDSGNLLLYYTASKKP